MNDASQPKRGSNGSMWSAAFRQSLPFESETATFVLISVLDIVMTYLCLRYSAEDRTILLIGESNPVARYFLYGWGVKGMVYFKLFMVAVVAILAQIIARERPETARKLLSFATLIVACVVLYSFVLLMRASGIL